MQAHRDGLRDADIVKMLDDNGGLLIDGWHLLRTSRIQDLASVPPGRVFATQFSDGPSRARNCAHVSRVDHVAAALTSAS